jgi:hypothetical protein
MLLARILNERHKPVLKKHVDLIFNLLFKCFLVPITLLVAGIVFQKTMFPWHQRTNTVDVSSMFRVTESFHKLVVLPIGLKESFPVSVLQQLVMPFIELWQILSSCRQVCCLQSSLTEPVTSVGFILQHLLAD